MSGLVLTAGQGRGLELARSLLAAPSFAFGVIVGYAGTGKTTLIKEIGGAAGEMQVACPTGKAAARVREATGLDASTIHAWLYSPSEGPGGVTLFGRRRSADVRLPPSRLLVIDEASMVGRDVWGDLKAIGTECGLKILFVGDGFQLPPVQAPGEEPFSVLDEKFGRKEGKAFVGRVVMDEILRQAEGSPIIRASMALRAGEDRAALEGFRRVAPAALAREAAAMHRRGGAIICHRNVTRAEINRAVRAELGISGDAPARGEPLLVTKNCRQVGLVNGDVATFERWDGDVSKPRTIRDKWKGTREDARFGVAWVAGREVTLCLDEVEGRLEAGPAAIAAAAGAWPKAKRGKNRWGRTVVLPHLHAALGYCLTCHKMQGSQNPEVLIVSERSVRLEEDEGRRWWYTAITRAERDVAICEGFRPSARSAV